MAKDGYFCLLYEFNLTVYPKKHPPVWSEVPGDMELNEGEYFGSYAEARDEDVGDSIAYSLTSDPVCGISINSPIGVISWRNVVAGKYYINITATDGYFTIWHIFNLTVVAKGQPPKWSKVPQDINLTEGDDFNFTANATDVDVGDSIVYGLVSNATFRLILRAALSSGQMSGVGIIPSIFRPQMAFTQYGTCSRYRFCPSRH
jgi:hypothetical protein